MLLDRGLSLTYTPSAGMQTHPHTHPLTPHTPSHTFIHASLHIHSLTHSHTPSVHIIINSHPHTLPPSHQEEKSYSNSLRAELAKMEDLQEKSGDQTKEELRAIKQMFEQSEESRSAS